MWCDPGTLGPTGRYQLYAQWRADEALRALADRLYLDLPVGVHPAGFDPWWFAGSFVDGVEGGAPPDTFFAGGQYWGFRPLIPWPCDGTTTATAAPCLRHLMTHAAVVRIDHVMGLHRLYWVPGGSDARHGVYVRSRLEELRAVVSLEAARSGTVVVGEDLGTVPAEMRPAMAASGCCAPGSWSSRRRPRNPAGATRRQHGQLGTHDLPRFAAFWDGDDLDEAESAGRRRCRRRRATGPRRDGWRGRRSGPARGTDARPPPSAVGLEHLAGGPAAMVLVDLEDLWLERRPVNRPGTRTAATGADVSARTLAEVRGTRGGPAVAGRPAAGRGAGPPGRRSRCRRSRSTAEPGGRSHCAGPARRATAVGTVAAATTDDLYLFNEGTYGGWPTGSGRPRSATDAGVHFAVWAPNARAVSVIGDWNGWDGGADRWLRVDGGGIWTGSVAGGRAGRRLQVRRRPLADGRALEKADPVALRSEAPPRTGRWSGTSTIPWADDAWMAAPRVRPDLRAAPCPSTRSTWAVGCGHLRPGRAPRLPPRWHRRLAEYVVVTRLHPRRAPPPDGAPVLRAAGATRRPGSSPRRAGTAPPRS